MHSAWLFCPVEYLARLQVIDVYIVTIKTTVFSGRLMHSSLVLLVVMLIPILPFVLFGEQSEAWFQHNIIEKAGFGGIAGVITIIAALVLDILLPVPSSAVITFAGSVYGLTTAVVICWSGLNLACLAGFWLGRRCGMPLVAKLCPERELQSTTNWLDKFGPWVLAVVRGLPVLAEASVLLAGAYRMSHRQFWRPVLIANLVLAIIYAVLGFAASGEGHLRVAILISIILPVVLLLCWLFVARQFFQAGESKPDF